MPLFSSKLELTNAASSSGVALSNIEFTRGAFYAVEKVSDLASIPVDRIAHDQIVWVESASATYQASLFVADYISIFEDSASWGVFTGFGGGESTDISALNTFTGSIQTEVNSLKAATGSYVTLSQTSSMTVLSASYAVSASIEILTEISSSHAEQADTASFVSDTFISQSALRSGFGSGTDLSSLNTFTGSIQTEVNSIKAATSSYALITDISGSFTSTSSSLASRISSNDSDIISLGTTNNTQNTNIGNLQLTGSNHESRLTSIEAATGSYVLASQTSSMTVLSASYAISSSVEILTEVSSSHAVQADTASFITDLFISQSAARSGFSSIDTSIFALTGSDYTTTNNIQITGSLTLQLDTEGDTLAIYSGSEKRFSITNQGVLVLTTQSSEPTATKGGMYLDSNYDLYIGQD